MTESVETHKIDVRIPAGGVVLGGELGLPPGASGVVLFAHGAGSSRHSPRNQLVAKELRRAGLATLLMDLLTAAEEHRERETGHLRFDIAFLSARVLAALNWLESEPGTLGLQVGLFGASTGAAAALVAAARAPEIVKAVVSRGGRPELAQAFLPRVQAPTLLIVGQDDRAVLEMNCAALAGLACEKQLEIVPGATHLFEEAGALETVASLAADWFTGHLGQ